MKKVGISIFLIVIFFLLINLFPEKEVKQPTKKNNLYKAEYEERYKAFQEKHPELKEMDILTRVNLNLDQPFYTNVTEAINLNTEKVFVNKYNFLKEDYVPENLEQITKCTSDKKLLVSSARKEFERLCEDIKKENMEIRVISAYRSYQYQENLYNRYKEQDGTSKADTYSARPGFSEHQTGLVIDVDNWQTNFENFEETKEFEWMSKNAHKYGFILRYPKDKEDITGYQYESWHYRYVGTKIATYIYENKLTLDEYYVRFIDNK